MSFRMKAISVSLAAGACLNFPAALAAPETGAADIAPLEEARREQLLNTLENLEATAAGINLSEVLGEQFDYARERVQSASAAELMEIPPNVMNNFRILELTSGQMRLMYDPELNTGKKGGAGTEMAEQGPVIQSTGPDYDSGNLTNPSYPNIAWSFGFDAPDEPDEDDNSGGGGGDGSGFCSHPGYGVQTRFITLNAAIASEAIKDIAEQACDLTVAGFNLALACVVTDIAAYINIGLSENQEVCNDFMTAAEVTATWGGIKTVHGNVKHLHGDLADVDSDLASHDSTVKAQIGTHDSDIKSQVATHDSDIKSQVAQHDADLKAQLAQHDADVKARLGEIQGTVDENQRLIRISMARQAELMRLMITPEGRRQINPDVISCTGADCPDISEILSCKNGTSWPCK